MKTFAIGRAALARRRDGHNHVAPDTARAKMIFAIGS